MRKTLLTLLIVSIAVGVGVVLWASYAQHDNAYRVSRAQKLVREIQQLAAPVLRRSWDVVKSAR
jgi:CHASE3 domain sensor protein